MTSVSKLKITEDEEYDSVTYLAQVLIDLGIDHANNLPYDLIYNWGDEFAMCCDCDERMRHCACSDDHSNSMYDDETSFEE